MIKIRICWHCGNFSDPIVSEATNKYGNGKIDQIYDEFCLECGTLMYGIVEQVN